MSNPAKSTSPRSSWTALEVLEMFKLLGLPTCDDGAAIGSAIQKKRDWALMLKRSPDPIKQEQGNRFFRTADALSNSRSPALAVLFQYFSMHCDAMLASSRAVGLKTVTPDLRAEMVKLACSGCQTDADLAERFVRDYLQGKNMKEGAFIGITPALDRTRKDEKNILAQAGQRVVDVFRSDAVGFAVGESPEGKMEFTRGEYVIESFDRPENYLVRWANATGRFLQFVLEVNLSKIDGHDSSRYGIVFGDQWPGAYHEILFDGTGRLTISKHSLGETQDCWHTLSDIFHFPHANLGNATNTLKIVHATGIFHTFLNGHYVTTVEDSSVRSGELGVVLAHGLRVRFSKLRLAGVLDLGWLYNAACWRFEAFEAKKGRALMGIILRHDAGYRDAQGIASLPWPDSLETVLVIVGAEPWSQLHDGAASRKLIEAIDKRGRGRPDRWAAHLTDAAFAKLAQAKQFAVVAIGGPVSNTVTGDFKDLLSRDPMSDNKIFIHHNLANGDRRVAVWGTGVVDTRAAVERFMKSSLLDQFLRTVWR